MLDEGKVQVRVFLAKGGALAIRSATSFRA